MKDLDKDIKGDKIEIVKQEEDKRGLLLQGQQLLNKGHTMYEINISTREVVEATYSDNYWNPITKVGVRNLDLREGCVYKQFLNLSNAKKWINKTKDLSKQSYEHHNRRENLEALRSALGGGFKSK
jgi:hypothetical protein